MCGSGNPIWGTKIIHMSLRILYSFSFLNSNLGYYCTGSAVDITSLTCIVWNKCSLLPVDTRTWITGMRRHRVQKWLTLGQITFTHCMLPWVLRLKMQRQNSSTIAGTWVLFLMLLTSSQQLPADLHGRIALVYCMCHLIIFEVCRNVIFK